jgi:AraC family transcriptional regulator of arabinose operon
MWEELEKSDDWLFSSHFKILRLPASVVRTLEQRHPLLASFFVTNTGYFTKVYGHNTTRTEFDEYIVIYCIDGKGWYEAIGQAWSVEKGEVLFVQRDIPHSYGSKDSSPWSIQWAHFRGTLAPSYLELLNITPDNPIVKIGLHTGLCTLFTEALDILQSGYSIYHLVQASSYVQQILSQIGFLATYSPPPGDTGLNAGKVIAYMLENITQKCTLDDFAAQACLSRSYFSRQFRKRTGYSPVNYFIRLKVQRACELLETTQTTVRDIAKSLGYDDQYYFSRVFKRIVGSSPTQYRDSSSSADSWRLELSR